MSRKMTEAVALQKAQIERRIAVELVAFEAATGFATETIVADRCNQTDATGKECAFFYDVAIVVMQ